MELTLDATRLDVPPSLGSASLEALLRELDGTDGPVLVARGGEEIFCAGLDFAVLTAADPGDVTGALDLCVRCLVRLATLPLPTIAVVTGRASGGGVGFAAACDVVLATPGASFALPEALFGLWPAMITPLLERRMSSAAVRRLSLTGAALGADEALRSGLVDRVLDPERLEPAIGRTVRELGRARPEAIAALKADAGLAAAIEAGRAHTAAALANPAVRERVRAFHADGVVPWAGDS